MQDTEDEGECDVNMRRVNSTMSVLDAWYRDTCLVSTRTCILVNWANYDIMVGIEEGSQCE